MKHQARKQIHQPITMLNNTVAITQTQVKSAKLDSEPDSSKKIIDLTEKHGTMDKEASDSEEDEKETITEEAQSGNDHENEENKIKEQDIIHSESDDKEEMDKDVMMVFKGNRLIKRHPSITKSKNF